MYYEEIIQKLRDRDERVTRCFFFWEGPTLQHLEELRKTDPIKAARLPKPVCNTCRPGLLKVLHSLYGNQHFVYEDMVTDLYIYLLQGDKLATIQDPKALMGWIVRTAYYYFLHEKIKQDKMLENISIESLSCVGEDIEEDDSVQAVREFVREVIEAMPNKAYAKILEDVTLEVGQYSGREKSEKMRELSKRLDIPIDNLYVKVSLAKKQFKETAKRLKMIQ